MRPSPSYEAFLARADLREGRMAVASASLRCPHPGCGKACVDAEALRRHVAEQHSNKQEKQ